jgi:hypothetical protein
MNVNPEDTCRGMMKMKRPQLNMKHFVINDVFLDVLCVTKIIFT